MNDWLGKLDEIYVIWLMASLAVLLPMLAWRFYITRKPDAPRKTRLLRVLNYPVGFFGLFALLMLLGLFHLHFIYEPPRLQRINAATLTLEPDPQPQPTDEGRRVPRH